MKKNNLDNLEFYTSTTTAGLVFILAMLQYNKGNQFWWIILIVGLLMSANAYTKYEKIEKDDGSL